MSFGNVTIITIIMRSVVFIFVCNIVFKNPNLQVQTWTDLMSGNTSVYIIIIIETVYDG